MSQNDRQTLRELAQKVRTIADLPEMAERRSRWKRHNLLQPDSRNRPMVLCFPEGGWEEILTPSTLTCTDPKFRDWEWLLRSRIFWWEHIHDDNFTEPYFDLTWKIIAGNYGFDIPMTFGDNRGSYVWDAPMKDLERDLDRLGHRTHQVDREATLRDLELAGDVFGDILPPRVHSMLWWTTGLTMDAAKLIGLENIMWAMYDQPQNLHRLMAFLRDDMMNYIQWCESENLLTGNDAGDYVGSGGVGCIRDDASPTQAVAPVTLADRWGFAESQETVGISPGMFEEFILPYQVPLLEKTALNCYGCCEGLEHRIDLVMRDIPRLRRVSVAPSANQEVLAPKLVGKYVYSRKPYPAHVCVNFTEEAIRDDLRHTLALAGQGPLEFILKDTHTVENDPTRLTRWVQIAYEEIDRYLQGGQMVHSTN